MYLAHEQNFPMGCPLPQEAELKTPPQVSFEPFRAEDPRLVASLTMREVAAPTIFIGTKNYAVQFYNCDGLQLGSQTYTIENKQSQDVLDVVPYCERDGKLFIAMNERIRPALAVRSILAGDAEQETKGLMWNLPGRYLNLKSGPDEIQAAVQSFLRGGLGLTQRGAAHQLGGSYLPSCGASPELCVMFAAPVLALDPQGQMAFQSSFEGSRCVRCTEAQTIVDEYLKGTHHDLRLVLAAFRLAKNLGYELRVTLNLSSDSKGLTLSANTIPVLSAREIRSLITSTPSDKTVVARISVEQAPQTLSPFVQLKRFAVTNHSACGHPIDTYEADVALRRGLDAVDVGCYTWIDGHLCMLVKRGVRPVIAIRALTEHPLSTDASPLGIEGIAESLEGERSIEAIAERAKQGIREEAGLEPSHQPTYIGYSYPSPGVNPERVYNFLSEVVPNTPVEAERTLDERVDLFYLPVDTLIELAHQGIIRDPRLELNAHLLRAAFEHTES